MQSQSCKYLNQAQSTQLDNDLMLGPHYKFSTFQLMELAGLSVAQSVHHYITEQNLYSLDKKILVICGPGSNILFSKLQKLFQPVDNGGDALIAARHLQLFGFPSEILYPKQSKGEVFQSLVQQVKGMDIPFLQQMPQKMLKDKYFCVLDGIFGYSFKGTEIRQPFKKIIEQLKQEQQDLPIMSIDVPSAWDVEKGNTLNSINPAVVISMAAPKLCMLGFKGRHYLGARFLPKQQNKIITSVQIQVRSLELKYALNLPKFPGFSQFVKL